MLNIHYISPCYLPSKAANAVHVIHQTSALAKLNVNVFLYGARSINQFKIQSNLEKAYGINLSNVHLRLFQPLVEKGLNIQIAIYALLKLIRISFKKDHKIYSRNLYAAFFFGVIFRRKIIFETHQIESGLNGFFQKTLLRSNFVKIVLITNELHKILEKHFCVKITNVNILSDAAPSDIITIKNKPEKINYLKRFGVNRDEFIFSCGYFGHLYEGRGIEIIIDLAKYFQNVIFLVFGGNDEDIYRISRNTFTPNLRLMGHVDNVVAREAMLAVDCLLMPYQEKVSIGQKGHDTARWMSPMKMFEYMSSHNPIISSDLPAIREILINKTNALLVKCDDVEAWKESLLTLLNDKELSLAISNYAFRQYKDMYNWDVRAKKIIKIIEN